MKKDSQRMQFFADSSGSTIPQQLYDPKPIGLQWIALTALLASLYTSVLLKLCRDWYVLPDFSHGYAVILVGGALLWLQRNRLCNLDDTPDWLGVLPLVTGLALLVLGEFGAELFLSRISILFVLCGLCLLLSGKRLLRALQFQFLLFVTAIPLPAVLYNRITFPLQLLASRVASACLAVMGVPVLRQGNILELSTMRLEVAEACSGIRSLMSLLFVAIVYAYAADKDPRRRVILVLSSIPIAVVANAFRIVGTGLCVQYLGPDKAVGFFHEFSGWLIFIFSVLCLFLLHRSMRFWNRRMEATAG